MTNGGDDRWAVCDVVYTFAQAMDSRDWTLYRSVFTPKIEIDYSFFHPDQKGQITASEWVDNVAGRLSRLAATQHSMTNPRPRIDGAINRRNRGHEQQNGADTVGIKRARHQQRGREASDAIENPAADHRARHVALIGG